MSVTGVNLETPFNASEAVAAFASTACPESGCALDVADFPSLVDELARIGFVDREHASRLRSAGGDAARSAGEAILRFRAIARDTLEALRTGTPVPPHVLVELNAELSRSGCRREVVPDGDRYRTQMLFDIERPRDVLVPLAHAIAETLVSVDPTRVKRCREPRCFCYFIDTSKNRTRTWCSMERCGNRAKVAAYYIRSKNKS